MTADTDLTWVRIADHRDHIWGRLPFVLPMAIKLARDCGTQRCAALAEVLGQLRSFLLDHLAREERVLDRVGALKSGTDARACLAELHAEHLALADLLEKMRTSAGGYRPETTACATERALYRELARLERHIRCQVALEERVLALLGEVLPGR